MKTSFVFLVSFLALGFTSAFKLEDHGHSLPEDEFARSLFRHMDDNHDGDVTFEEMKRIFTSMDLDIDGQVTKSEFITRWLASNLGHANNGMVIFGRVDTNGDGLLDLLDVRRFYSYFDTNGDTKVSDVEFVTVWISMEHS